MNFYFVDHSWRNHQNLKSYESVLVLKLTDRFPVSSSKNWKSEVVGSNKYQRYKDKIKLPNETNKAKYLLVASELDLDFEKNINNAPKIGNKINDDKIGKSII